MLSENRLKRRTLAVTGRALCVSAAVGLGCSLIPATVSASPVVVASPSTPTHRGARPRRHGRGGTCRPAGLDQRRRPRSRRRRRRLRTRHPVRRHRIPVPQGSGRNGHHRCSDRQRTRTGDRRARRPAATPSAALAAATPAPGAPVVGATGPAVVALQQALMAAGVWLPRGADGVFGTATTRGISNFQSWNRLTVSGVVDASTFARLKLGAPAASPTPPAPARRHRRPRHRRRSRGCAPELGATTSVYCSGR